MEKTPQINLVEEKETLFITLYTKALDSRSKYSVLHDTTADNLIKSINYDFSKFKHFGDNVTDVIIIRAKQFDEWVKEFINANQNAVILYLGCGLDTRITRINPPSGINWFDVDYPEVINLRANYYSERPGYKMIATSITSQNWLKQIPTGRPTMIIAEGVFEYFTRTEVKSVLGNLLGYFTHGQIIFDVMNSFAVKSGKEKLKNTTGAVHKWAVDNIEEIDNLQPGLKRINALPIFKSSYIRAFPLRHRSLLALLSIIPNFKNMMRLMRYKF